MIWANLSLPSVITEGTEHPLTTVSLPLPPYYILKATEMFSQFRRKWPLENYKAAKIDEKLYLGKPLRRLHNGLT